MKNKFSRTTPVRCARTKSWSLAIGVALSASSARAVTQTFVYTPTGSTTNWSAGTAGGWSATPVSASTTELTFGSATNSTVLASGTSTSNNDITGRGTNGGFLLNILDFNGTGPAGAAITINITGNPLEFALNGTTAPVVNLNALKGSTTGGTPTFNYNVSNNLVLDANTTFQGGGNAAITFTGNISGTGSISKTGNTGLTFSGTNSFGSLTTTGAVTFSTAGGTDTINGNVSTSNTGTVSFGTNAFITGNITVGSGSDLTFLTNGNTVSGTGTVTVNSGGTLLFGNSALGGNLQTSSGAGAAITDNGTLLFNYNSSTNVRTQGIDFGAISGTGGLYQGNSNTVVLTMANNYSGGTYFLNTTNINAAITGTVQIGNASASVTNTVATPGSGPITFGTKTGTLAFDRSDNFTFANTITGSGNISQVGPPRPT